MLEKSGQSLSPCVEVNGDEVEAYLLEAGVLHLTAAVADAPATERTSSAKLRIPFSFALQGLTAKTVGCPGRKWHSQPSLPDVSPSVER